MASMSHSAYSPDGQFLAICGTEGKLRIWDTEINQLKQEFVPDDHLSSPCSVLGWFQTTCNTSASSPWKRQRKKSVDEEAKPIGLIAMGSANGTIILYDVFSSSVSDQLENGHSSTITALTWSPKGDLFTAAEDKQIVEWNLKEKSVKCKWKVGKGRISSLLVLPDGKSLLSGQRTIKWWDLETKQVIGTFTGHANGVNGLTYVQIIKGSSYLFSSGIGDDYLSVWSLTDVEKHKEAVTKLMLDAEPSSFSVKYTKDSQIMVLSTTKLGNVLLFKYQPNGPSSKPIKPTLSISVANNNIEKESVRQVPILIAEFIEDTKILLAYGKFSKLIIEKVVPDFSGKVQCIMKSRKSKDRNEESVKKIKRLKSEIDDTLDLEEKSTPQVKKNKVNSASQVTLKHKLECLTLNTETIKSNKTPFKDEVLQSILKGVSSKDKNLLRNSLLDGTETTIQNIVIKLPAESISPLLEELAGILQENIKLSNVAITWLQAIMTAHATYLLSQKSTREILLPLLPLITKKKMMLIKVEELKLKANFIMTTLAKQKEKQEDASEECLLNIPGQDSSDEELEDDLAKLGSESDDNWKEMSDEEYMEEDLDNGKMDDDASLCGSD